MLEWIFDGTAFTPRDQCGEWTPSMSSLYRLSNLTIAMCYFAIPVWLWVLYRARRADIPHPWYILLFVAFILFCGVGHLCNYLVFDWPAYRFFALIDGATALFSLATVACIPVVARSFLDFPSWSEYARKVDDLVSERTINHRLIKTLWEFDDKNTKDIKERDELIRQLRHQIRNMATPAQAHSDIRKLLQEKLEQIRQVGKKETPP